MGAQLTKTPPVSDESLGSRFYGDISSSMQGIPKHQRPQRQRGLTNALLRSLFILEGEQQLQQVLHMAEQQPDMQGSAGASSWSRVMRVPTNCNGASAQVSCHQLLLELTLPETCQRNEHAPSRLMGAPVVPSNSQQPNDESARREVHLQMQGQNDTLGAVQPMHALKVHSNEAFASASPSNPFTFGTNSSTGITTSGADSQEGEGSFAMYSRQKSCPSAAAWTKYRRSITDVASDESPAVRSVAGRVQTMLSLSLASGSSPGRGSHKPSGALRPSPLTRHLSVGRNMAARVRSVGDATAAPATNDHTGVVRSNASWTAARAELRETTAASSHAYDTPTPVAPLASGPDGMLAPLKESSEISSDSNCVRSSQLGGRPSNASGAHALLSRGQLALDYQDQEHCWHQVNITRDVDPETGKQLLLIYQSDVTFRTMVDTTLARMAETQLATLCQIFPRHIIEFLSTQGGSSAQSADLSKLARSHNDVSILFMDIVGFTNMSKQVPPAAVMTFLNSLFKIFDGLCLTHAVHKVETAGDCYIVSSGIMAVDADGFPQVQHAHDPVQSTQRVWAFAKDMMLASRTVLMPHDNSPVVIRIGIHTGSCVSGMIGSTLPKFSIFGDTMNTASRMESTCTPGRIQISATTHSLLTADGSNSSSSDWCPTGGVEVKGKGLMQTFVWCEPPLRQ